MTAIQQRYESRYALRSDEKAVIAIDHCPPSYGKLTEHEYQDIYMGYGAIGVSTHWLAPYPAGIILIEEITRRKHANDEVARIVGFLAYRRRAISVVIDRVSVIPQFARRCIGSGLLLLLHKQIGAWTKAENALRSIRAYVPDYLDYEPIMRLFLKFGYTFDTLKSYADARPHVVFQRHVIPEEIV